MVNCAIILAGGKGERLRPYTNDRPKVMVEVAGKPILAWQIEWLKSHGITKFILTVSYKHEVVEQYFGDGSKFGIEIDYSYEETPLGRGGGIKKAFKSRLIDGSDVVVCNGDIIKELEPLLPEKGDHEYETFPKIPKEKFLGFKDEGFWRAVDVVKDKSEAEQFLETGTV